ncbi:MAG: hypothetical protein II623_01745 [Paludibacteraceae bacterium]|nr:hypothetical protein [Paludibacteraceae bacterium]
MHLGSTSYLTDTAGNVSQFVWYAPYGESLVDEHTTTYENPFKFSGKELDDITGLYDHGARNRNPITAVWYGVDPLYTIFPEISPYQYCHANPVRFVDLNGMFDSEKEALKYAESHDASRDNVHYSKDRGEWYVAYGEDGKGYQSGGYCKREFGTKLESTQKNGIAQSESWMTIGNRNTALGTSFGGVEYKLGQKLEDAAKYTIKTIDGIIVNSARPSVRFGRFSHDFDPELIEKIGKGAKRLGRISGVVSAGMIGYEIYTGQKNLIGEGGLDLVMTGVAFIPVYGWAVSGGYFLGKYILEESDLDFWNR